MRITNLDKSGCLKFKKLVSLLKERQRQKEKKRKRGGGERRVLFFLIINVKIFMFIKYGNICNMNNTRLLEDQSQPSVTVNKVTSLTFKKQ